MFKQFHQHSFAFRLAHLVVFGALFFVQMQVSFIEHAYGSDANTSYLSKSSTKTDRSNAVTATNSDAGYTKLNKRYPFVSAFTVMTPEEISHPSFAFVYLHRIYKSPYLNSNFNTSFSFRGPPVSFLA